MLQFQVEMSTKITRKDSKQPVTRKSQDPEPQNSIKEGNVQGQKQKRT